MIGSVWDKWLNKPLVYTVESELVKNDNGLWDVLIVEKLNDEMLPRLMYLTNTGRKIAESMASALVDETIERHNAAWDSVRKMIRAK